MRSGTIAFLAGILLLMQLVDLPPSWVYLLLFFIPFVVSRVIPYRLMAIVLLGFLWGTFRAGLVLTDSLDREIEGRTVTVRGKVVSLPGVQENRLQFEFLIDTVVTPDGKSSRTPGKVRLNWYKEFKNVKPGEFWQLDVRLKRPRGFMNPGGFDFEGWLFQHRIRATGYVTGSGKNIYLNKRTGQSINRLRFNLRQKLETVIQDPDIRGLINALSLGDRSQISSSQKTVLINTGTSHLLAISGLHIGLIAGMIYFLTRRFWSYCGVLPCYLAAPRAAAILSLFFSLLYAALAGFSIPTQRALIMLCVILWSQFSYRQYTFSNIMSLALLLVLLLDPFAVMAPGFWLSFGAIGIIAYGMCCRSGTDNLWWRWGRVQYLVAIGLLPLLLIWFQQYPVSGFFANIVAVPWVSLIVVPASLLGVFIIYPFTDIARGLLDIAAIALKLLWYCLEWLAGLDGIVWYQSSPTLFTLFAGTIGVFILLQPAGMPARWLGIIWMFPLFLPQGLKPAPGEMRFTLLDVGQGLSAVVETHKHVMVYDTGDRFSKTFNAAQAALLPFLRNSGIKYIDKLVISHGDKDHIGGAEKLLNEIPVTEILTSVPGRFGQQNIEKCKAGQTWQWDGVFFHVLHPDKPEKYNSNNQSCVIKVEYSGHSVLLSGDIDKNIELMLINKYKDKLAVNVLVVPHHGSKTSSSTRFIQIINPELALIPSGYLNRFRFPNIDIITRYQNHGVRILNTAIHGAINITINGSGMSVRPYRKIKRRFWHSID